MTRLEKALGRTRAPAIVAGDNTLLPTLPDVSRLVATTPQGRLTVLGSSGHGLSEMEAAERRCAFGANEPVVAEHRRPLLAFFANFTHTLALLLWFAAGLAFAAGIPELGAAIVAVVAINGIFAYVQEHRAEQLVSGLMRRVAVQARVVRDGQERRVSAADLVPGDVVRLSAGDLVPADAVIVSSDNLALDLSMLTGETLPVERDATAVASGASTRLLDLPCVAPAGSAVITGSAEAAVFATGPTSTLGTVAAMVQGVERGASLLERQVGALSRVTAVIAVLAGAVTLSLTAAATNVSFLAALTFATGVIVALVPEGLLPTLSVALAIGAGRMATRGAAVRRLAAVEIVGSVTAICTDKTGTLTFNALSTLGFVAPDGATDAPERAIRAAALCNDARPVDSDFEGDPLDVALARWVTAQGYDVPSLRRDHPRLSDLPFEAGRRSMSVTCEVDGRPHLFVKGAPEAVLAIVGLEEAPAAMAKAVADATARGERVLLLAAAAAGESAILLGLVRFSDPPRPEVPAAIDACRRAGVRIAMLTGDHPATAMAVAKAVGLGGDELPVIDGDQLDRLTDRALLEQLKTNAIFARIDPRQKLRIVSLLRGAGEVVVVTGDGINDAPALRAADVGVAMGRRGTEVAKQAADIVLADDNFATIVAAIEEGRSIKANIRRFVSYVFTSNVAELAPFLLYIFLPVPLPLAVVQVLAIDLGTDLLPALALGAEAASPRTMDRPPEPPRRPLLTRALALRTFLFFGALEAALGLGAFFGFYLAQGWRPFASLDPYEAVAREATTMTFLGIVAGQIGCLFAQRDGSLRARLSLVANPWILWGLLFELGLTLALVYVPGLNRIFAMAPVAWPWLAVLPAGATIFVGLDVVRRWLEERGRKREQSQPRPRSMHAMTRSTP
jgi:calcium-translocating P-type ATPase